MSDIDTKLAEHLNHFIGLVNKPKENWREFEHDEAVRTGIDRYHLTENDFVPYEYHVRP